MRNFDCSRVAMVPGQREGIVGGSSSGKEVPAGDRTERRQTCGDTFAGSEDSPRGK